MKLKSGLLQLFISWGIIVITVIIVNIQLGMSNNKPVYNDSWEKQLNEMNYLIMKASSINIINGLNLTRSQGENLDKLVKKIESLNPPLPDMKGEANNDLVQTRKVYNELLEYIVHQKQIPDLLKNRVIGMRLKESEIIKKSLLGSKRTGYHGMKCQKCHAPPDYFPIGDVSKIEMDVITKKKREEIDTAHIQGIFGEKGTFLLWELKSDVDMLLTDGQKILLKNFRCCLIPPTHLQNPTNIGQAFITNEWMNYFKEIRKVPPENWPNLKPLFIIPVEDYLDATLPGIRINDKKDILNKVDKVIEKSRQMDTIDFELQKGSLCLMLKDALNIDNLLRETVNQKEERQFLAAVFLLLPGNSLIYNMIIKHIDQEG